MTIFSKTGTALLLMFALAASGFSQRHSKQPAAAAQNLIRGVFTPFNTSNSWANYSLIDEIPGSGLFPITSSTTVLYLAFTAGSEADITNMVLYTTARASKTITAVTPVKLGGISNPSIILSNTSVCPVQPLSSTNPCVVRLDPTAITLSPGSDYYLSVYFTNNGNNQGIGGIVPSTLYGVGLSGEFIGGTDETHLAVGQSVPGSTNGGYPYFLMAVMTN